MVDKASFIIKDVFTLLNSAMCLNSRGNVKVLTFPPFCYVKIRKKDEFASILTAWFYFVFAKKLIFQLGNTRLGGKFHPWYLPVEFTGISRHGK